MIYNMKNLLLTALFIGALTLAAGCTNQVTNTITPTSTDTNQGSTTSTKTNSYLTYVKSTEDPLQYCDGANMDSEGFKKTITDIVTTDTVINDMTQSELAKATVLAATSGMCKDVMEKTDITVEGDTAYIGQIDAWAGVSIVMCSCKPEIEVNLMRLPGINNVVFK